MGCRGAGGGRGWNSGREERGKKGSGRGPQEAGGTSLGGRRRNNGALPAASPQPGGASSQPGGPGAAGRYGARLLPGSRSPCLRREPRLHLLSPTTALRPMGAIALRESSGSEPPHATPADTAASPGRRALPAAARRLEAALGTE